MHKTLSSPSSHASLRSLAVFALLAAGACARTDQGAVNDPLEAGNRSVHAFNIGLDKVAVRPVSRGYAAILPDEIEESVSNFADNFAMPSVAVNAALQGDLRNAGIATSRFIVNTALGFAGFFDPATDLRMPAADDTDFGETLHVWGAGEGAFVMLPVLGPSTVRDTAGRVVDIFTNPLGYALPSPERSAGTVANVGAQLTDRQRFSNTVDSIYYDSADGYAQLRITYLQNRRFELGQGTDDDAGDPYADPYDDPYEDPYAE